MTATGALIARHVTDLFPTQTSRFDLAQAARRGVISAAALRAHPARPRRAHDRQGAAAPRRGGHGVRPGDAGRAARPAAVQLRRSPTSTRRASTACPASSTPPACATPTTSRQAFRDVGLKAQAVSGETPKRELAQILARYERGDIDVLVNAQLLAEGWNSPRATVCMHLAPTASKRIYQQRVGRVTRRQPGKEAGIVVDFVHPATKHDDPVVTLHSLLDRDVYRGGAIVVGPVRRGRGRRLRVERRVLPVTADENRRIEVFERELWRIAVEHLDYGEQVQWAALAGARVAPAGWRRARAMLHFDQGGELKRAFLLTAIERNKNPQLRLRALQEVAASRDAEAFDRALDFVEGWPREEKREGVKAVLLALAEKKIGRRDQANNWIWRCANMTREVHEEYAVQRWPETKRLLGLLVNSSGGAHARNARRLVHAARQQDRRLSAALLAAAIPHTAEAGEVINGARTRMSRKPAALARELLRNFPKGKSRRSTRGGARRRAWPRAWRRRPLVLDGDRRWRRWTTRLEDAEERRARSRPPRGRRRGPEAAERGRAAGAPRGRAGRPRRRSRARRGARRKPVAPREARRRRCSRPPRRSRPPRPAPAGREPSAPRRTRRARRDARPRRRRGRRAPSRARPRRRGGAEADARPRPRRRPSRAPTARRGGRRGAEAARPAPRAEAGGRRGAEAATRARRGAEAGAPRRASRGGRGGAEAAPTPCGGRPLTPEAAAATRRSARRAGARASAPKAARAPTPEAAAPRRRRSRADAARRRPRGCRRPAAERGAEAAPTPCGGEARRRAGPRRRGRARAGGGRGRRGAQARDAPPRRDAGGRAAPRRPADAGAPPAAPTSGGPTRAEARRPPARREGGRARPRRASRRSRRRAAPQRRRRPRPPERARRPGTRPRHALEAGSSTADVIDVRGGGGGAGAAARRCRSAAGSASSGVIVFLAIAAARRRRRRRRSRSRPASTAAPGAPSGEPIPAGQDPDRDLKDFSVYVFNTPSRRGRRRSARRAAPTSARSSSSTATASTRAAARRARRSGRSTAPPTSACTSTSPSTATWSASSGGRRLRVGVRHRPRGRPPRPAAARHERRGRPRSAATIPSRATRRRCGWSCRPTATPASGRAACSRRRPRAGRRRRGDPARPRRSATTGSSSRRAGRSTRTRSRTARLRSGALVRARACPRRAG